MDKPFTDEITVTVAASGANGTTSDPCNPINSHWLQKVQAYCAADTSANSFKVELLRQDPLTETYYPVYTSSDEAIPDDADWHNCDSESLLNIPLSFPKDGNYTWRVTPDLPPAAAMSVKIRRTLQK